MEPLKDRIKVWDIDQKNDHRGWFEVIVDGRTVTQKDFGSLIVALAKPGIVRGNHYHKTCVDFLAIVQGTALCGFLDANTGERLELEVAGDRPKLIYIPTHISHAVKNIGQDDVIFVEYSSLAFDEKVKDIHQLQVL